MCYQCVQSPGPCSPSRPTHPGEDTAVADAGPGGPACALQAGHRVLPRPQGPGCACSVSAAGQPWRLMGWGAGEDPPTSNAAARPLQAPALPQKHPCAVRGGSGVRQLHERRALAENALGQMKPCLSPHELVGRCHAWLLESLRVWQSSERPPGLRSPWMMGEQRNVGYLVIINEDRVRFLLVLRAKPFLIPAPPLGFRVHWPQVW